MSKKVISCFLTVCLLLTMVIPGLAEEGPDLTLDPCFLTVTDWTATEWYEDYTSRTLLATCALMDLFLAKDDTYTAIASEAMINNAVYVCKKGLTLYVFFYGDEDMALILFKPLSDEVEVGSILGIGYSMAEGAMKGLKEDGLISSYYQIDSEDILTAYEMIISD